MTTLTIRKASKEELQAHIDAELACYALRTSGFDTDMYATPNSHGIFPRKHFLGGIEQIVERSLIGAMHTLQRRLDEGYKIFLGRGSEPEVTSVGAGILYVTKPEAPAFVIKYDEDGNVVNDEDGNPVKVEQRIEGVIYQCDEKKQIIAEVTAKYTADIDAHNEKVFAQEAVALKAEEAAVAAQLKAEDEQRAQAEFDKRVRDRMRGSRAGAK